MRITRLKTIIFSLSIIGIIFLSPLPNTVAQAQGDANQDGMVTSADITCVILGIFGLPCPMPDCNEDGMAT